jgi:hypothetical protein
VLSNPTWRNVVVKSLETVPGEEWREYRNILVSSKGRCVATPANRTHYFGTPDVSFHLDTGYRNVYVDGVSTGVHRVVAQVFLGDPPYPKAHVDHLDGNRSNNCSENLRWVSCQANLMRINVQELVGELICEYLHSKKYRLSQLAQRAIRHANMTRYRGDCPP